MTRELDAAIVRGLEYILREQDGEYSVVRWADSELYIEALPHYSSDGNDMLELDGEMRERGWYITNLCYFSVDKLWECKYEHYKAEGRKKVVHFTDGEAGGHADTMPKAVALATYKALSGEEWTE